MLDLLRPLTQGALRVVFGCGGDRDRTKRPVMGRAVAARADALYVTSD
ncbi:MAG TPA: cyanophycin synthetase, partial [Planctomycetota bacterium]|nr:cyanophycin synthetase [Planctomycetota bacterium]